MNINYSSISQFQQLVELKDYRPATKREYVRYVRKLAEHFQCDPATLSENQIREYFLFLRQHKHYKRAAMKAAKFSLRCFFVDSVKVSGWTVFNEIRIAEPQVLPVVLAWGEVQALLQAVIEPRFRTVLALKYLAAYVYRTAFSAEKIVADDGQHVTFCNRDNTGKHCQLKLSAEAFLHRFLQHVLPKRLQRVRHFGWLSAAAKERFERVRALLDWQPPAPLPPPPVHAPQCPCCQKPMQLLGRLARPPP